MSRTRAHLAILLGLLLLGALSSVVLHAAGTGTEAIGTALRHINDSRYGGRGADLIPEKPTAVRLRSAEVLLAQVPVQDGWQVSASYDLYNPGTAPVPLSLLLPEDRCPKERPCSPLAGGFQDLGMRLGADQLVEPTAAPAEALRPWAEHPGKGYLYPISVPPRKDVKLSQEYRFDQSRGTQFWGVHYLSSAGRWGGPVAMVRYVVELKQPTPNVIYPRTYKLTEFSEHGNEQGPGSTIRLVFAAERQAGRSDFLAIFPADALAGHVPAGHCDGFRGDLADDELAKVLRNYDGELLRACRDLVYALHGRPFADAAVRARHYGTPPRLPDWADGKWFAITPRQEDPGFREGYLGPGEQAYVKALAEEERRRKK